MDAVDVRVAIARNDLLRITTPHVECECLVAIDALYQILCVEPSADDRATLVLAAAIYSADRLVRRNRVGGASDRAIDLTVELPRNASGVLETTAQWERLCEYVSGDHWKIRAIPADPIAPEVYQRGYEPSELSGARVSLMSDGLDSAAGLALSRDRNPELPHVAVSVRHNPHLWKRARHLVRAIDDSCGGFRTIHVGLGTHLRGAPRLARQETTQRTRGILFATAGALVAKAVRCQSVVFNENGPGAFNVPVMRGMLVSGFATRGAHPKFLDDFSHILSTCLHSPIRLELPHIGSTKAEMIRQLHPELAAELVNISHTCASAMRVPGKDHCGVCPACIERRIDVSASGLNDDSRRYNEDITDLRQPISGVARDYLTLRLNRATEILDNDLCAQRHLRGYFEFTGVDPSSDLSRIATSVYQRNAQEAVAFLNREMRARMEPQRV